MWLDGCVAACLIPLACWILVSSLDDLVLALAFLYRCLRRPNVPSQGGDLPRRRIAVFVPLWHEHGVIEKMVSHNLAANRYQPCDFFLGVYPNDAPTCEAARAIEHRFPNVHLALCPHDGPTSKADCLNWIFQRMLLHEEQHGTRFDVVVTHDAEDLIHPRALEQINRYSSSYDMVQIPVLALPTPLREWTHGVYCDEFAEYQIKDVPMRTAWGGFLPSNGVGTGYSREVLELLARTHSNRIFDPASLTEDYENGFRIHALGRPQCFVSLSREDGNFVATREYFPRTFRDAVRQRARWVTGIALQSWQFHGWKVPPRDLYWFWRDRKGLVGNLVVPLANLLFAYSATTWTWSTTCGLPWHLGILMGYAQAWIWWATMGLSALQMSIRAACVARIYGLRFALGVPLRMLWGNWINCAATAMALKRFFQARLRGEPLVWIKTSHTYPSREALTVEKRRLGEILVGSQYLESAELEAALLTKPGDIRLGEHLVALGKLDPADLYEALSLQQNMPFGRPEANVVSAAVTRSLPARLARKWKVLPFRVLSGQLYVLGPELPSDAMTRELSRFSSLELQYQLVTPDDFEELAARYLP